MSEKIWVNRTDLEYIRSQIEIGDLDEAVDFIDNLLSEENN